MQQMPSNKHQFIVVHNHPKIIHNTQFLLWNDIHLIRILLIKLIDIINFFSIHLIFMLHDIDFLFINLQMIF
jgi:hypothetical protein